MQAVKFLFIMQIKKKTIFIDEIFNESHGYFNFERNFYQISSENKYFMYSEKINKYKKNTNIKYSVITVNLIETGKSVFKLEDCFLIISYSFIQSEDKFALLYSDIDNFRLLISIHKFNNQKPVQIVDTGCSALHEFHEEDYRGGKKLVIAPLLRRVVIFMAFSQHKSLHFYDAVGEKRFEKKNLLKENGQIYKISI